MLVLLIMFIITIPVQTHAVKLDLPVNQPQNTPPPIEPVKNEVAILPGNVVLWNGAPINLVTLRQYLNITTTMTPVPELHLRPHPEARYETVDEVLAVAKRAQVTAMGFVGNEAYANF
jgi:biopolymer transport protein ExbD